MSNASSIARSAPIAADVLLVSSRDAARMLAVSERTLWDWTSPRGTLACVRRPSSGRVLYSVETIRRWIAEQETNPPVPASRPRAKASLPRECEVSQ